MFTLRDMNRVLPEIKGLSRKTVFSMKKSALSYSLSQMSSQHRGATIEKMVRDILVRQGNKVKYIGGNNSFDMEVNGQRLEVKSSMPYVVPTKKGATFIYRFQNIKTKFFDRIILVYITPNGLEMRGYSNKTMTKMLRKNKYYSNGKTYTVSVA